MSRPGSAATSSGASAAGVSSSGNSIRVVCRFRPQNSREISEGGVSIVSFNESDSCTFRLDGKEFSGSFTFDSVYPPNTSQEEVFASSVESIVGEVLRGYNGTVFAYGQTGSGKTFTMMGSDIDDQNLKGVIPRIVEQIFLCISTAPSSLEFTVKVAYMEIYMEKIRDLLNPANDNLQVHEDKVIGVYVRDLVEVYVSSIEEILKVMHSGQQNRVVAATQMNAESSRSHSILVLTITQKNTVEGTNRTGRLYLVDLAGSEKVSKTGVSGQTLEEAKKINKSLTALGMVINALTDGRSTHVPYRDSKLTRILQESLGGNSQTTLIINASPSSFNESETLSTLRFGMRAKSIKNKATINQELSPAELQRMLKRAETQVKSFKGYVITLENELEQWRAGSTVSETEQVVFRKLSDPDVSAPSDQSTEQRPTSSSFPGSRPSSALSMRSLATEESILKKTNARPGSALASSQRQQKLGMSPRQTQPGRSSTSSPLTEDTSSSSSSSSSPSSRAVSPTSTIIMMDDERAAFVRRENELVEELEQRESELRALRASTKGWDEESAAAKDAEKKLKEEIIALQGTISDLRLQLEKQELGNAETQLTLDSIVEKNSELESEIMQMRASITELEELQERTKTLERELLVARKMCAMMPLESTVAAQKQTNLQPLIENDGRSNENENKEFRRRSVSVSPDITMFPEISEGQSANAYTIAVQKYAEDVKLRNEALKARLESLTEELEESRQVQIKQAARLNVVESNYDRLLEKAITCAEKEAGAEKGEDDDDVQQGSLADEIKGDIRAQYDGKVQDMQGLIDALQKQLAAREERITRLQLHMGKEQPGSTNEASDLANEDMEMLRNAVLQGTDAHQAFSILERSSEKGDAAIKELFVAQVREFEYLRTSLLKDFQSRCERIVELEMAYAELRGQYDTLMRSESVRATQSKIQILERNIEQLTQVQRQQHEQANSLRRDLFLAERKLVSRNQCVSKLEKMLKETQRVSAEQKLDYDTQVRELQRKLRDLGTNPLDLLRQQPSSVPNSIWNWGRVAKPLRGGGGTATATATASNNNGSGAGSSPLMR